MKKFFRKPIFIVVLIIVVIIVVFFFGRGSKNLPYEIVVVKKGEVTQEVSVTGQVKSEKNIDLAFEKAGRITSINVKVGDKVFPGQILIQLANADIAAQLVQAQADVKAQEAKLEELKKGTRLEEMQVQEAKVANAKVSLENAKRDLADKLQDAYTKSDDAVRNKIDQFFTNPRGASPQIVFSLENYQLKLNLEKQRLSVESFLGDWKTSLGQLTAGSDFNSYFNVAKDNLDEIKTLLDDAALALNSAVATAAVAQASIDGWKSDVSTARTNLNTAIVNLSLSENGLRTAQSDLILAEQELNLKKAGSTPEQITIQEAEVEQAEANAENYQAQLAKTMLRSPINGIVAKQDGNVGEIIAANATLVSLISENNFKIEANIPETDIAKVKVGNQAKISLDAYGNDIIFDAIVAAIDPAETVIGGVATYKTTLYFTNENSQIKPGMTANIDISTARKENVLVIPQRVVTAKNGGRYVLLDKGNGKTEEKEIKLGLRGSDGQFEVLDGLSEGERIVIP